MDRELGEFVDAGFKKGGIFVNIGYLLQMWSGDVLIATTDDSTVIETLDGSGKYPPVTSGQWQAGRFKATYDK
ncbi:hypothetical protein EB796_007248 [Bugula neritina]|uniref:Uncharacterized protein n=1 Tax=Bugula neritina TaxID=10212 RepID=A0A7J7K891_BUGNE|nr:hypothetical protein EB796_007248 [Bugula neritina]